MAYTIDKAMATFFGRPPMINSKYCSCSLPLELDESQLPLTGAALDDLRKKLDIEGWNPTGAVNRLTWLRGAIINLRIREDILELSLGCGTSDLETRAA